MTTFADFGLSKPILTALAREGHNTPTPIQEGAIPVILKGRDLLGIAQTGTGKTAAFALPILHHLAQDRRRPAPRECRVLVLAPTRELALQVLERFNAYGAAQGLSTGLVIGGVAFGKQRAMLHRGLDILVATPGRLIDMVDKGAVKLDNVEHFVLDEVDQMLDLGFIHSIRSIAAKLPDDRQNIFFSATMPPAIAKLASNLLNNPARVEMAAAKPLKIDQSVIFVEKPNKAATLVSIVKQDAFKRGLVFSRTKHGADKIVRMLNAAGAPAHAIHGNRSQAQREKALNAFRKGKASILVATDIAARGIDVQDVTHVVNYDLPNTPETYTHRIGRTGRAGAAGTAISFCSGEERPFLRAIEKLTKQTLTDANGESLGEEPRKARGPRSGARKNGERKDWERKGSGRKPGGRKFDGRKSGNRTADGVNAEGRNDASGKPAFHGGDSRKPGANNAPANENRRRKGAPNSQRPPKPTAYHSNEALPHESADDKKGQENGEGRTNRVRRRRHRGAPGRQFSSHAG